MYEIIGDFPVIVDKKEYWIFFSADPTREERCWENEYDSYYPPGNMGICVTDYEIQFDKIICDCRDTGGAEDEDITQDVKQNKELLEKIEDALRNKYNDYILDILSEIRTSQGEYEYED